MQILESLAQLFINEANLKFLKIWEAQYSHNYSNKEAGKKKILLYQQQIQEYLVNFFEEDHIYFCERWSNSKEVKKEKLYNVEADEATPMKKLKEFLKNYDSELTEQDVSYITNQCVCLKTTTPDYREAFQFEERYTRNITLDELSHHLSHLYHKNNQQQKIKYVDIDCLIKEYLPLIPNMSVENYSKIGLKESLEKELTQSNNSEHKLKI